MTVTPELTCESVEERNLVALYAAEKLNEESAEAFEQHYFDCDRCWNEVRRAAEIRASHATSPAERSSTLKTADGKVIRGPWMRWRVLAVAAAAAFVAVGAWQILRRPPSPFEPVLRGGSTTSLSMRIEKTPGGGLRIAWTPEPTAGSYSVEVIRADGVSMFKREVSGTSLAIDAVSLPRSPGQALYVRIEARDAMGQSLAKSPLQPLPAP